MNSSQSGVSPGRRSASQKLVYCVAILTSLCLLEHSPGAPISAQAPGENQGQARSAFGPPTAGEHTAATAPGLSQSDLRASPSVDEISTGGVDLPRVEMAPTRSSFLASWNGTREATGYRLDVSTSPSFEDFVSGYRDLDVGAVTSRIVSGLNPGSHYYYRTHPHNSLGDAFASSETMTATTATSSGLVIVPTFDSSITNDPKSGAIQSMINATIALYQTLFSDSITVQILFRYSKTLPDGSPFIGTSIARSDFVVYHIPWNSYIPALYSDGYTANDAIAKGSLPPAPLSPAVVPSGASGRAIGFYTPPGMFADGSVSDGGPYDGIVTLNSGQPFQFTRPPGSKNYDAQRSTEHEIDEILGLSSFLGESASDLHPEDLFTWASPGNRNLSSSGARYFSIDSGSTNIVGLNQNLLYDLGDWVSDACPQAHPYVQNAFSCKGQVDDITTTSPEGISLDVIGYDLGSPNPTRTPGPTTLGNISTRLRVETGDQVLIGGFIISGTEPKNVVVRAIGPSLPLAGALADPTLELHSDTALLASNDDWRSDQETEIIASGFQPSDEKESAIVMTLTPGTYTAIVKGVNDATGLALVEVYDLDSATDSTLANISTRGFVQTDDDVLIGGFIFLGGDYPVALVRAIGPSLPVSGALTDPMLELHDTNGQTIVSNDDWRSNQESAIIDTGLAPTSDAESAILAFLAPAPYTVIVRGKGNATGLALVEVYQLQ